MKFNMPLPTQIEIEDTEAFRACLEAEVNKAFVEWFDSETDRDVTGTRNSDERISSTRDRPLDRARFYILP